MRSESNQELLTEDHVRHALSCVIDPEAGMNIVDLGLVYGVEVAADHIYVALTMTSRACPMGDYITDNARHSLRALAPQVRDIQVHLVWEPPWHPQMMSEAAKGHFGWG